MMPERVGEMSINSKYFNSYLISLINKPYVI